MADAAATSSSASQDAKPAKPRRRRKAGRKKRRTECALERVVGVTSVHNASFAANPVTGDLAYPAGCVVVILSASGEQTNYFRHTKAVSALTFSPDGRFLAVGERGRQPSVTVWDVQTGGAVVSLAGHRFGVACLAFSDPTTEPNVRGFQQLLARYLKEDGLVAAGGTDDEQFRLAQFDALNSLGARRSEIWIDLEEHPW